MNDGIIKGTGNSRFLKSAISDDMTWEQFKALIRAGTLPIDLFGINPAGWDQLATALNKANLLTDATAALLALTGNPTVNDALAKLSERAKIALGYYVGTGTSGQADPTRITFDFDPKVVIIFKRTIFSGDPASSPYDVSAGLRPDSDHSSWKESTILSYPQSSFYTSDYYSEEPNKVTWGNKYVEWYATGSDVDGRAQLNEHSSGLYEYRYHYVAFG